MSGPALYWGLLSGSSEPNARMNLMPGAYFCRAFATAESNSSRSGISPDSINCCASLRRSATECVLRLPSVGFTLVVRFQHEVRPTAKIFHIGQVKLKSIAMTLVVGLAGCTSKPDTTVRVTSCTLVQHENAAQMRWTVAMYTLKGKHIEVKGESAYDQCDVPLGTRYSVGGGFVEVVNRDDLPQTATGLRHDTVLQITSESMQ